MSPSPIKATEVVLVVEDEGLLRMLTADNLREAGYDVIEADNSDTALRILKARTDIHVLFTDIQMPGPLNGIELARKVHEQWPNVLLLVTSGNLRPVQAKIPDHGHFIAKPYQTSEVITEIGKLAQEAAER